METLFMMMAKSIVTMTGMKMTRSAFKGTLDSDSILKKHKVHRCNRCGRVYSGVLVNCRVCGSPVEKMYEERIPYTAMNSDKSLVLIDENL